MFKFLSKIIHPNPKNEEKSSDLKALEEYQRCIREKIPYFGDHLQARQGGVRYPHMRALLTEECRRKPDKELLILEIGSYAGGSAIVWGETLMKEHGGRGKVFCIDPFQAYFTGQDVEDRYYDQMNKNLNERRILNLFLHNVEASGLASLVVPMIGYSHEVCAVLKEGVFDLVYIDGNHYYDFVKKDLIICKKLVSEDGILCGDDLERSLDQVDYAQAWENRNQDYRHGYHPGVTLAVHEELGKVAVKEAFWAVRKTKNGWTLPDLS